MYENCLANLIILVRTQCYKYITLQIPAIFRGNVSVENALFADGWPIENRRYEIISISVSNLNKKSYLIYSILQHSIYISVVILPLGKIEKYRQQKTTTSMDSRLIACIYHRNALSALSLRGKKVDKAISACQYWQYKCIAPPSPPLHQGTILWRGQFLFLVISIWCPLLYLETI